MNIPPAPGPAQDHLKGGLTLLILATLQGDPAHGYGLARTIERRTENALQLREGTLYPALHGLERDGLIVSAWETPEKGRERKVYTLTLDGERKLAEWSHGWQEYVAAVAHILAPPPSDALTEGETPNGTRTPHLRPAPGGSLY